MVLMNWTAKGRKKEIKNAKEGLSRCMEDITLFQIIV